MRSCSSRIARRPVVHEPQSNVCARLHLNSYHLTYGRLTALTLTRSLIRFKAVYQKPIRDVDQMKQRLVEVWSDVQQTVVEAAIGEWRKRLRVCFLEKGHYFEHLL